MISEKIRKLVNKKARDSYRYVDKKVVIKNKLKVDRTFPSKFKDREVLKEQNRVTVQVNQPVYEDDKSRFFKEAWKEEKKQLYFK